MADLPPDHSAADAQPATFEPGMPLDPGSPPDDAPATAEWPALEPSDEGPVEGDPAPHQLDILAQLDDRLAESQRLLVRQTEIAASLHEENQRLRQGELRQAQAPLIREVLRVVDDVAAMVAADPESASARDLDMVRSALMDALARNGIEPVVAEPASPFDPKAHKVTGVEPTSDPALDRTVAEVVRVGFAWDDGDTIRVADVRVHKFREPAPPAEDPAPADPVEPSPDTAA